MIEENSLDKHTQLTEQDILQWLESEVNQQQKIAIMLVDDYWRQFKKFQKENRRYKQGRVGVRIRSREKCLSFSIEWFRISSIQINGQSKSIAEYIRKGPGFTYPLVRMLNGEPEWEAKLVEGIEVEFAKIRKTVDALGKIRDRIRYYHQFRDNT